MRTRDHPEHDAAGADHDDLSPGDNDNGGGALYNDDELIDLDVAAIDHHDDQLDNNELDHNDVDDELHHNELIDLDDDPGRPGPGCGAADL